MKNNLQALEKKLSELKLQLKQIDEKLSKGETDVDIPADKLKTEIKSYLNQLSGVLVKVIKLSGGLLVLKDGQIVCKEYVAPFEFTVENVYEVLSEQKKRINYALKYMSENGISARYVVELGKSLQTLYAIFKFAPEVVKAEKQNLSEKQLTAKAQLQQKREETLSEIEKVEAQLKAIDDEFNSLSSTFVIQNCVFPETSPERISIPLFVNGSMRFLKYWNADDGLLYVKDYCGKDANFPIVKAIAMRAIYSQPSAEVNMLYCASELNDEMFAFFNKLDDSLFFEGTKYLKISTGAISGDRDFNRVLERVVNVCEERMKLLGNTDFSSIGAYNAKNPDDIKKPIFVFLQGYPCGYESSTDLKYLFESGKKYGVYFIVIQTHESLKRNEYSDEAVNPADYASITVELNDGITCDGVAVDAVAVTSDDVEKVRKSVIEIRKAGNKIISYEEVGFGEFTQTGDEVAEEISIPVGKIDNKVYNIEFAVSGSENKPIAYLLVGAPSSGKSSLIDSMIFNGSMKYSPDDLTFYLIDFKDGVSSAMYINQAKMPHIKVVAQHSKKEDAEIILHTILKEQQRRNEIFKNNQVNNLTRYNKLYDKHMPRIIVVIDEASVMFNDDGETGSNVEKLISMCATIARQGRSAGIHLVLASQSVERKMKNITDFVNGRFCFKAAEAATENTLSAQNAKRVPIECKDPGVALVSHDSGETVRKVKFAYNNGLEAKYAEAVRNKWAKYPIETAVVGDDSLLTFENAVKSSSLYPDSITGAAIGENYYNRTVEYLPFNENHHTLMLLGQNEDIQTDHLISVMIYALKQKAQILLLDESGDRLLDKLFGRCDGVESYTAEEYLPMLSKAYGEYKKRAENRRQSFRPFFVIIHSIHMIADFEKNRKYVKKRSEPAFDDSGYMSLRALREETPADEPDIYGEETFFELLSHAGRPKETNVFICFSADRPNSFNMRQYETLSQCDFKIANEPFVSALSNVFGRSYTDKLGASCSKTISLLSVKQQTAEKIRYFHYEDTDSTRTYIKKEISE